MSFVICHLSFAEGATGYELQRVGEQLARCPVKSPIEILFRELLTLSMRAHHELEVTPQLLGWGTKKALRSTEAELLPR
jgi:hypothetical protein